MIFIGVFFYFLLENISFQELMFYIALISSFYFVDKIFSFDFEKHHYFYLIIISLPILFSHYIQSIFIYIDKPLHLIGGIMLTSITYHLSRKINIPKQYRLITTIFLSVLVILSYELYEYISDELFNTTMQGVYKKINDQFIMVVGKMTDTIQDIILGIIGIFIYLVKLAIKPKV